MVDDPPNSGGNSISNNDGKDSFCFCWMAASTADLARERISAWVSRFFDADFSNGDIPLGKGELWSFVEVRWFTVVNFVNLYVDEQGWKASTLMHMSFRKMTNTTNDVANNNFIIKTHFALIGFAYEIEIYGGRFRFRYQRPSFKNWIKITKQRALICTEQWVRAIN